MGINWDLYNTRLNLHGNTQRDRIINEFHTMKENKAISNPSYKTVTIEGISKQVLINSKTDKSKFSMSPVLHTDAVLLGSKVVWKNTNFLVVELSTDNDVFIDSTIQQCNYTLPFQLGTSDIIQEPCIVESNQTTDGINENKVLTLPDDIRIVKIQYNDNTKNLYEDKRIFIDTVRDKPRVYKITSINTISGMDGEHGLWILTCKADGSYSETADNKSLRICNYISESAPTPSPTPTTDGSSYITHNNGTVYGITDICSLKEGGTSMPFNAVFKDTNGNILTGLTPTWTVTNLNSITSTDIVITYDTVNYPMRAYLQITKNTALIGATFKLHLVDSKNTLGSYDVNCKVVSLS